jgi:prepilin-type processing-associated H-X9-DG protein
MKTKIFFKDESCPIVIHEKENGLKKGWQALYDIRNKEYVTKFHDVHFDTTDYNSPGKWYKESGSKYFIAHSSKVNVLFVDYQMILKKTDGTEISYFTMQPNGEYVVFSNRGKGGKGEAIYSIKEKKMVTPWFVSMYPFHNFPKNPYYKGHETAGKEAIFKFPENKRVTSDFNNMMSVGEGWNGDIYYTSEEYGKYLYWMKWNKPILHNRPEEAKRIFGDLKKKITYRQAIKKVFQTKWN